MIDTHCHVDLTSDPIGFARRINAELAACVAVTMLPSHYEQACRHLLPFARVTPALGLHPLRAREARHEVKRFELLAKSAQFVGEIGIDGSREGRATFALQKALFTDAVAAIQPGSFVTIHSREAWQEVLDVLQAAQIGPVCFHYFTGGEYGARSVLEAGGYLSVNERMVTAESRHRETVAQWPQDRVLVETDAPFAGARDPIKQLQSVYRFLSLSWNIQTVQVENIIHQNFMRCRTAVPT